MASYAKKADFTIFVLMKNKGLTKKQLRIQLAPFVLYILMGVMWVVMGINDGSRFILIAGAAYLAFSLISAASMVIQRKRHPIEDPELDATLTKNFKTGLKGGGLVFGIIAIGFLIAFGLAALLK